MRQRKGSTRPAFARLEGRLLKSHLLQTTAALPVHLSSQTVILAMTPGPTPRPPEERGGMGLTISTQSARENVRRGPAASGVKLRNDPFQSMDDMIATMGPAATDDGHVGMTAPASVIPPQLMTLGPHSLWTPAPVMMHSPGLNALKFGAIVSDRQHGEMKGDIVAGVVESNSLAGELAETHPLGPDAGLEVRLDAEPGTSADGIKEGRPEGELDLEGRLMEGGMQGPADGPKLFLDSNSSIDRLLSVLRDPPDDPAVIPEETTECSDVAGDGMSEGFSTMAAAIFVIVPLVSRGPGIDKRRLRAVADGPPRVWRCLLRLFGTSESAILIPESG